MVVYFRILTKPKDRLLELDSCTAYTWILQFAVTISFRGFQFKKYKRHKMSTYRLNDIPAALFSGVSNLLHPYLIQFIVNRCANSDTLQFYCPAYMSRPFSTWDVKDISRICTHLTLPCVHLSVLLARILTTRVLRLHQPRLFRRPADVSDTQIVAEVRCWVDKPQLQGFGTRSFQCVCF